MKLQFLLLFLSVILGLCWGFRFELFKLPIERIDYPIFRSEPYDGRCVYAKWCWPKGTPSSKVMADIGYPDERQVTIWDIGPMEEHWTYRELGINIWIEDGLVVSASGDHFH